MEKYKILIEITDICLYVIEHIQKQGKKENQGMTSEKTYLRTWKDTNMAVVDTLLKTSYVIDQYIPQRMLQNLEKCVITLKSSPEYGLGPIVNMIEANIYTNVSG